MKTSSFGRFFSFIAALAAFGGSAARADDARSDVETFRKEILPLVKTFCFDCHGAIKPKAGFRLDTLGSDILKDKNAAQHWNEILNRLNLGEMPPKKSPQPAPAEMRKLVGWITEELRKASAAARSTGGRVMLRRLNRAEYSNSIESLLGVPVETSGLPSDGQVGGFDTGGSGLIFSALLIEQYLQLGAKATARALDDRAQRPETELWRLEFREAAGVPPKGPYPGTTFQCLRGGDPKQSLEKRHPSVKDDRGRGVSIKIAGPNRPQSFVGEWAQVGNNTEPEKIEMGVGGFVVRDTGWYFVRARAKCEFDPNHWQFGMPDFYLRPPAGAEPYLKKTFEELGQPELFEVKLWLERGQRFGVRATASLSDDKAQASKKVFYLNFPRVYADWIEIEGPCFDFPGWPSPRQKSLLAGWDGGDADRAGLQTILSRFVSDAYRRPVANDDVAPWLDIYDKARAGGSDPIPSLRAAITCVLASSRFVYLVEPGDDARVRLLDAHELASRLSYFLWSAPPDAALRAAADDGSLLKLPVLRAQAERLLADRRSAAFCERFVSQWMSLDQLENFAPDGVIFPHWNPALRSAMRNESIATFADMLHGDRPLAEFLKGNTVIVNESLAAHYGIKGVFGARHRPVTAPPETGRGGLLTQGSVLCLTSNGTRTSPVKRGVYILEKVLLSPPPPPPPNAGEIANKVPGEDKITVRERLRLHREVESCAACHNKIDPLGFALEKFDGIGILRNIETSGDPLAPTTIGGPIDASGSLPDGTRFADFQEMEAWLLREQKRFVRCLTSKLFTYGIGREPEFSDREQVETIVSSVSSGRDTLRDIILALVVSEAFRTK